MRALREHATPIRAVLGAAIAVGLVQWIAIEAGWIASETILLRVTRVVLFPLLLVNTLAMVAAPFVASGRARLVLVTLVFVNLVFSLQFFLCATLPSAPWSEIEHDFALYYHGSRLALLEDHNVYLGTTLPGVHDNRIGYVASPPVLLFFLPFTALPFGTALLLFNAASLGLLAWCTRALAGARNGVPIGVLLSAVVLTNGTWLLNQRLGQISALVAILMAAGVLLLERASGEHRGWLPWAGGSAFGLAILLKVFPVFVVGYLALAAVLYAVRGKPRSAELRALLATTVVTLAGSLAVALTLSPDVLSAWWSKIRVLSDPGMFPGLKHPIPTLRNYVVFMQQTVAEGLPVEAATAAIVLPVAGLTLWLVGRSVWRRAGDGESKRPRAAIGEFALLVALLPFVLPLMWSHYLVFLVIPVAWVYGCTRRPAVLALLSVGVLLVSMNSFLRGNVFPDLGPGQQFTVYPDLLYRALLGPGDVPPGRVLNLYNLLVGFPGAVMIWLATCLTALRD